MPFQKETRQVCTQKYGIRIRFAGSTSIGLVRERNEDNFVVANLTDGIQYPPNSTCVDYVCENGSLFAVCDGMGGAAAGNVASKVALDSLFRFLRAYRPPGSRDELAYRLVKSVEKASHRVYQIAQKDSSKRGMGTTLTAGVLVDNVLFLAQIGDSRAYLLRKGELKQLTKDQTLINQMIELGVLKEDEAINHQTSNLILQALGTRDAVSVDLTFVELRKNDRLMICSDGLNSMVCKDDIRRIVMSNRDPLDCCIELIATANKNGGRDNVTTIIADFDGTDLIETSANDSFGYQRYRLPHKTPAQNIAASTTARPPHRPKNAVRSRKNELPVSACSSTESIESIESIE